MYKHFLLGHTIEGKRIKGGWREKSGGAGGRLCLVSYPHAQKPRFSLAGMLGSLSDVCSPAEDRPVLPTDPFSSQLSSLYFFSLCL